MFVIKLSGGLGNKMFQYAFGFVLQKRYKILVKYDFKNSYRDMYLVSLCKNIIISNSTFSWWAAC